MSDTMPASMAVAIIERGMRGQTPERIAREVMVSAAIVTATLRAHGHPSVKAMREQADLLRPLGGKSVTFDTAPTPQSRHIEQGTLRPKPPPVPAEPTPSAQQRPSSPFALIAKAKATGDRRLVKMAERADDLLRKIESGVEQWEADEQRRQKIAKLEGELAALKGAGSATGRSTRLARGVHPCAECDRIFDTPQGITAHRRIVHEGFRPRTAS